MRPVLSVLRKNISDADIGPEVTSMSNHQKLLAKLRIWRARHGGNHNALAPSRPRSNPQHESDSSDEDDNVDDQDNDADQGFLGRSGNEYDEGVSASDNQESTTPLVSGKLVFV